MGVTDKAGRVKKGERCIALSADAKRCRKTAKFAIYYHGDPDLPYHPDAQWVRAAFCEKHS